MMPAGTFRIGGMLAIALLSTLLAAPPESEVERYTFAYRFEAGSSYVDEQEREWWLESVSGEKLFRWKFLYPTKMKRTIVEVDETAHPSIERVEVIRFARTVVESSTEAELEGTTKAAGAEGQTFVWRRMKQRWGLYDAKGEVTEKHSQVVTHLQNWRDALPPPRPRRRRRELGGLRDRLPRDRRPAGAPRSDGALGVPAGEGGGGDRHHPLRVRLHLHRGETHGERTVGRYLALRCAARARCGLRGEGGAGDERREQRSGRRHDQAPLHLESG